MTDLADLTEYERCMRLTMVLLRCLISFCYLWLMLEAAAIVPIWQMQSKSSLLNTTRQYVLSCRSLLPGLKHIQFLVIIVILLVLLRLYQCCRSNFLYNRKEELIIGEMKRVTFSWCLFLYFTPYLILFVLSWITSTYLLCANALQLFRNTKSLPIPIYFMFGFAIVFKLFVLSNGLQRSLRAYLILKLLDKEVDTVINPHDFGEHLNMFFQN